MGINVQVEVLFGRRNWVEVKERHLVKLQGPLPAECTVHACAHRGHRQLPTGLAAGEVGPEIGACSNGCPRT